jgi:PPM family protein phosphatase
MLVRAAATTGDAETGLRQVHAHAAAEPGRDDPWGREIPSAVAVVAVRTGSLLRVAWCGDARAYHLTDSGLKQLTTDHNQRQQMISIGRTPGPYDRNIVTSYLGDTELNPPIGTVTVPSVGRLLLASDGAYEPLEDSCRDIAQYLTGTPTQAARAVVTEAIRMAHPKHTDNATALVADLA